MDRLLRRSDVENLVALRRSAIYALMQDGKFPKPLKVAGRAVRWRASDIATWIAEQVAA
jgi:prophage regulatory protein